MKLGTTNSTQTLTAFGGRFGKNPLTVICRQKFSREWNWIMALAGTLPYWLQVVILLCTSAVRRALGKFGPSAVWVCVGCKYASDLLFLHLCHSSTECSISQLNVFIRFVASIVLLWNARCLGVGPSIESKEKKRISWRERERYLGTCLCNLEKRLGKHIQGVCWSSTWTDSILGKTLEMHSNFSSH